MSAGAELLQCKRCCVTQIRSREQLRGRGVHRFALVEKTLTAGKPTAIQGSRAAPSPRRFRSVRSCAAARRIYCWLEAEGHEPVFWRAGTLATELNAKLCTQSWSAVQRTWERRCGKALAGSMYCGHDRTHCRLWARLSWRRRNRSAPRVLEGVRREWHSGAKLPGPYRLRGQPLQQAKSQVRRTCSARVVGSRLRLFTAARSDVGRRA
mmetsp:Transcript_143774/g.267910  ORF Transcript_143774/g.267910 Transcript_143774/m.267910 type:complete len:209 (-) Transcript_143774:356-982(-)